MRYALLIYAAPEADRDVPRPAGTYADSVECTRAMKDSGCLVGAEHLLDVDTATTVRHRGERILTDGPFAETKEHLLGFYLIDVPGLDEALEWAARLPMIGYATVEVRAAHTGADWQAVMNE
jgi:hypothetical protein